ncbi:MAG TPA: hypothetical protein VM238_18605 [Phycisphaerae bacterium]|nr:hypothetical protein [Phycisphaerae bacterium]
MSEPTYPVYRILARWIEDMKPNYNAAPWQTEGVPAGKIRNSTSHTIMFREEPTMDGVFEDAERWWAQFQPTRNGAADAIIIAIFVERETWCLGWFNHWTFDVGQTDQEALASFEVFVARKKDFNHQNPRIVNGLTVPAHVLMGAEDRWRWSGKADDDQDTPPPCRCKWCKEQGRIRINH